MKTIHRQVKYYERLEAVLPTEESHGFTVRIEMEDGGSFVFNQDELTLEDFVVLDHGSGDALLENYREIVADWDNPYTMIAIWEDRGKEKPSSLKIVCCDKAYDNFWEEIWPSRDDISDVDWPS